MPRACGRPRGPRPLADACALAKAATCSAQQPPGGPARPVGHSSSSSTKGWRNERAQKWPQTREPGRPGWSVPAASLCGWSVPARPGGAQGPRRAHRGRGNKGPGHSDGLGGTCWQAGPAELRVWATEQCAGPPSLLGDPSHGGAPGVGQSVEGAEAKGGEKDPSPRLPLGPGLGGQRRQRVECMGQVPTPSLPQARWPCPPPLAARAPPRRAAEDPSLGSSWLWASRGRPLLGGRRGAFWKAGRGGGRQQPPGLQGPAHLTPFTHFPAGPGRAGQHGQGPLPPPPSPSPRGP
uniref:Uncharacterized protein n=1 Tax=Pipistrellus kuhlii TaxID=59472 RepID=A0A7J7UGK1_PIPKU|nr:hypothetical protein mPipKuh1_009121 [Pipistrellus kuhlii]